MSSPSRLISSRRRRFVFFVAAFVARADGDLQSSASLSPSVTAADISDVAGTRPLSLAKDTFASFADDVWVAAPRPLSFAKHSSVTVISPVTAVFAVLSSPTTTVDSDADEDMTLVADEDEDPADSPIAMSIARGMLAPFRRARAGAPVAVPASHAFFEGLLARDSPTAPSKSRARRARVASRAGKENTVRSSAPRRTTAKFVEESRVEGLWSRGESHRIVIFFSSGVSGVTLAFWLGQI
jgi:hypothetical protein